MFDIISVGHICIDITPSIPESAGGIKDIFVGGKLINVNNLSLSTGGSVSNTGVALNKLGLETCLVAKVGNDILGQTIKALILEKGANCGNIIVSDDESTSYSVVLAIHGVDRIFLHNPGVNNTFTSKDVNYDLFESAKIMHFGYPTIMRQMFINDGAEFIELLQKAKLHGVATSVDMSLPDPSSESGNVNWMEILSNAMPAIDIFMPSIEEIIFMLDRKEYDRLKSMNEDILVCIDLDYISGLGKKVMDMGAKIVVFKCGTLGYYLKTSNEQTLNKMGRCSVGNGSDWSDKEIFSGIFEVDHVVSATGAGDTSIAGFLAGLIKGMSPEECMNLACGTGAFCVAQYGAVDGIVHMDTINQKIRDGWKKREVSASFLSNRGRIKTTQKNGFYYME